LLEIEDGSSATFIADGFQVHHDIPSNNISEPQESARTSSLSFTASDDGSITLSGGEITLAGFYTGVGDQIFLTLQDSTGPNLQTGLLIATLIPEPE